MPLAAILNQNYLPTTFGPWPSSVRFSTERGVFAVDGLAAVMAPPPTAQVDDAEPQKWSGVVALSLDDQETARSMVPPTPVVEEQQHDEHGPWKGVVWNFLDDTDAASSRPPDPPPGIEDLEPFSFWRGLVWNFVDDVETASSANPPTPVSQQDVQDDHSTWRDFIWNRVEDVESASFAAPPAPVASQDADEYQRDLNARATHDADEADKVPNPPFAQQDSGEELAKNFGIVWPLDLGDTDATYPIIIVAPVFPSEWDELGHAGRSFNWQLGYYEPDESDRVPNPPVFQDTESIEASRFYDWFARWMETDESDTVPPPPVAQDAEASEVSRFFDWLFRFMETDESDAAPPVPIVQDSEVQEKSRSFDVVFRSLETDAAERTPPVPVVEPEQVDDQDDHSRFTDFRWMLGDSDTETASFAAPPPPISITDTGDENPPPKVAFVYSEDEGGNKVIIPIIIYTALDEEQFPLSSAFTAAGIHYFSDVDGARIFGIAVIKSVVDAFALSETIDFELNSIKTVLPGGIFPGRPDTDSARNPQLQRFLKIVQQLWSQRKSGQ